MKIKVISILLIIVLIANMTLLALRKIPELMFWAVIIACAIASYFIKKARRG